MNTNYRFRFRVEKSPLDKEFERSHGIVSIIESQIHNLKKQQLKVDLKKQYQLLLQSTDSINKQKSITQLPDIFAILTDNNCESSTENSSSSSIYVDSINLSQIQKFKSNLNQIQSQRILRYMVHMNNLDLHVHKYKNDYLATKYYIKIIHLVEFIISRVTLFIFLFSSIYHLQNSIIQQVILNFIYIWLKCNNLILLLQNRYLSIMSHLLQSYYLYIFPFNSSLQPLYFKTLFIFCPINLFSLIFSIIHTILLVFIVIFNIQQYIQFLLNTKILQCQYGIFPFYQKIRLSCINSVLQIQHNLSSQLNFLYIFTLLLFEVFFKFHINL
ncbi:Transmembrane domain-containing protein [Spironucleus salmonicida]|uniref:Transmembrane domain-containing protein n=1 Tax=Spironucleus salmonicida TaxID=348837 RepID=A0A9P8LYC0_9EUKA|nr:Transmembrane domain-containing protein [Spironucleus salmonicida]